VKLAEFIVRLTVELQMKKIFFIITILLIYSIFGFNSTLQGKTIFLDCEKSYPLGMQIDILEDPGSSLTIDQVQKKKNSTKFYQSNSLVPSFGFTDSTYWVRFSVKNQCSEKKWLLELSYALMDNITLYRPSSNIEKNFKEQKAGYSILFKQRDIKHRFFVFKLDLPLNKKSTFYMRFKNTDRMIIPLTLWDEDHFHQKDHTEQYILGIYYGIIIVMLLYNLFLFITIRDKTYLYYVLYIASFLFWQLTQNGFAYEYFWPENLSRFNHYIPFSIITTSVFVIIFTANFLNTKVNTPFLHRMITISYRALIISSPLFIIMPYDISIQILIIIALAGQVIMIVAGIKCLMKGYRPAAFYLIAWSTFIGGGAIYILMVMSIIPTNTVTTYAIQAGSAIEVILLSLGLGDRINILKREKDEAQAASIMLEHELEVARKIQFATIPKELPLLDGCTIATAYIPMQSVGGDFYDIHVVDDLHLGLLVTDVSGHGIPAALIASMVKISFQLQKHNIDNPTALITEMNNVLTGNIENQFLTAGYIFIDMKKMKLLHSSAGHVPLAIYNKNKNDVIEYKPKGCAIGWNHDYLFDTVEIDIEPGDRIILYTDGIIEARNENDIMYGDNKFFNSIKNGAHLETKKFIEYILSDVQKWSGTIESFEDDLTIVTIDIKQ